MISISEIKQLYTKALSAGHIIFSKTSKTIYSDSNINFEIRVSTNLAKKPSVFIEKNPFNPFLPCDPNLLIETLETHNLLFNKFCIVETHLLLTTKHWETQATDPTLADFTASSVFLNLDSKWLCFFNMGRESGASVDHKHIQLLPIVDMIPIQSLIDSNNQLNTVFTLKEFPFIHSIVKYKLDFTKNAGAELHEYFKLIKTKAFETLSDHKSFNLAFTADFMIIVPRRRETFDYNKTLLGVNSVAFIGWILVKGTKELEAVSDLGVISLLKNLCFPVELVEAKI